MTRKGTPLPPPTEVISWWRERCRPLQFTTQVTGGIPNLFNSNQGLLQWLHTAHTHPKPIPPPHHVSPTEGLNHIAPVQRGMASIKNYGPQFGMRMWPKSHGKLHKCEWNMNGMACISLLVNKMGCWIIFLGFRCFSSPPMLTSASYNK